MCLLLYHGSITISMFSCYIILIFCLLLSNVTFELWVSLVWNSVCCQPCYEAFWSSAYTNLTVAFGVYIFWFLCTVIHFMYEGFYFSVRQGAFTWMFPLADRRGWWISTGTQVVPDWPAAILLPTPAQRFPRITRWCLVGIKRRRTNCMFVHFGFMKVCCSIVKYS